MYLRQVVGRGAAGILLFAAGCAPGNTPPNLTPESSGGRGLTQDCNIPAHIRGTLPEAIASATEVACRGEAETPIPEQKVSLPTESDIKIEKELLFRCAPGISDPRGDTIWGGWLVKFDRNPGWYLKGGKAEVDKYTPSSGLIGKRTQNLGLLLPGVLGFVPAGSQYIQTGEGSQLGSIALKITSTEWGQLDKSDKEYIWKFSQLETGYSPNVPMYPPRMFRLVFNNESERVISGISLFGLLLDSENRLVDMFRGEPTAVSYGASKPIYATSFVRAIIYLTQ